MVRFWIHSGTFVQRYDASAITEPAGSKGISRHSIPAETVVSLSDVNCGVGTSESECDVIDSCVSISRAVCYEEMVENPLGRRGCRPRGRPLRTGVLRAPKRMC